MEDLAKNIQTLMAFGMSADEAQLRLGHLGDISQGDAQKLESLTLAFAEMSSTGKLTGQDLNQMINAEFNPLEEMSRKTGKSIGELKEEMGKGAMSADMVADAFASATAEGDRFYGAIDAQSMTFSGQLEVSWVLFLGVCPGFYFLWYVGDVPVLVLDLDRRAIL